LLETTGTLVLSERSGPVASTAIAIRTSSTPTECHDRSRRLDRVVSPVHADEPRTLPARLLVNELIEANVGVARSIASRYRNRGVDLADLEQVALLGLIKAAQRFDADAGHDFLSYAVPTIRGEVRRHFRDAGWMVRPPRRVQELQARIRRSHSDLEVQLGRSPRPSEVAGHLGEDLDEVLEALTVDGCFTPTSLDKPLGEDETPLGELISHVDGAMEAAEARAVLRPALQELNERDRRVLHMRFFEGRTQQEIADELGLTQAQVSRVLSRVLATLRLKLGESSHAA
jgi:RNA polymerase sigma-B factor